MGGIFFEEFFVLSTSLLLGVVFVFALLVLVPSLAVWRSKSFFIFVAGCFSLLHAWQWQESSAAQLSSLLKKEHVSVEGEVVSEPKISRTGKVSFFLTIHQITFREKSIALPVKMKVCWEGPAVAYGDFLRFDALAHPPASPRNPGEFDVAAWLARQEIDTELTVDPSDPGVVLSKGHGSLLLRSAFAARHWAEDRLEVGIADVPNVVALIKGITLGVSHDQLPDAVSDFQVTGTMHLFAISGLHVGMVAMIVWFFLKLMRVPRRLAVVLSIPVLFFYVMMTGFHTGSWRAAIMASIVLCGFLCYRRPQLLNSLAAAAFFLLAAETNLLFSPGWQFSFGVVVAIVLFTRPLQKLLEPWCEVDPFLPKQLISLWHARCLKLMRHVLQLISVSVASWIGALVPTAYYFHHISFSALGANVVAVPFAFIILATALITLFVGLFSSWLASVFNNANLVFVKLLLLAVHGWAFLPFSSVSLGNHAPSHPMLTLFDAPGTQVAFLEDRGARWLINTGNATTTKKIIFPFLEMEGVTQLQGIFCTTADAAHLGGVSLLSKNCSITSIILSCEQSRSPSFHGLLKEGHIATPLHAGDHVSFSSECFGDILYPPVCSSKKQESAVVMKIYLKQETVLLMPTSSPDVKEWLLEHEGAQLQATTLVFPSSSTPLVPEDRFLRAVAPRCVVIGRDPRHQTTPNPAWKELFRTQGITLFYQEESGALIFNALPEQLQIRSFLNKSELKQ